MACVPEDNSHRAPSPQGQWASNYLPTAMHSQKLSFHSFQIDRNMIVRTVLEFSGQPNGIPSGSKSEGKRSPRSYSILFERKWKSSFLSVDDQKCEEAFVIVEFTMNNFLSFLRIITSFLLNTWGLIIWKCFENKLGVSAFSERIGLSTNKHIYLERLY